MNTRRGILVTTFGATLFMNFASIYWTMWAVLSTSIFTLMLTDFMFFEVRLPQAHMSRTPLTLTHAAPCLHVFYACAFVLTMTFFWCTARRTMSSGRKRRKGYVMMRSPTDCVGQFAATAKRGAPLSRCFRVRGRCGDINIYARAAGRVSDPAGRAPRVSLDDGSLSRVESCAVF